MGSSWGRGEDRLEGRFVNQGKDHSLHNHASQYRRESETVLGQFVSYPDGLTHQNTFGIVRNSDGSSVVEQPPQLPDSVLRGHFTQADIPSGTETRQQNLNQQEDEEYPYQQQTFQDHGQQSFQPPNESSFDRDNTQLQLASADFAHQECCAPEFVTVSPSIHCM